MTSSRSGYASTRMRSAQSRRHSTAGSSCAASRRFPCASNAAVQRVHYPGLESHAGRAVARRQMRLFGGMVSFEVKDEPTAFRVLERLEIFALAESLGAVESLAEHPARMTHASIPESERKRSGVGDGLIRLSVGVEDVADLIADLEHALAAANA